MTEEAPRQKFVARDDSGRILSLCSSLIQAREAIQLIASATPDPELKGKLFQVVSAMKDDMDGILEGFTVAEPT